MAVFKKLKKGGKEKLPEPEPPNAGVKSLDRRIPFDTYRDFYTLKNYWKSVDRKRVDAANGMLFRYLSKNPDYVAKYSKLKNVSLSSLDAASSDKTFEAVACAYLKVFDDVISAVEEKPHDASAACDRLQAVGKMHKSKVAGIDSSQFQAMEEPFLAMVSEILQDRYNDKAENLFRKFYQFCLKYLVEGFNS